MANVEGDPPRLISVLKLASGIFAHHEFNELQNEFHRLFGDDEAKKLLNYMDVQLQRALCFALMEQLERERTAIRKEIESLEMGLAKKKVVLNERFCEARVKEITGQLLSTQNTQSSSVPVKKRGPGRPPLNRPKKVKGPVGRPRLNKPKKPKGPRGRPPKKPTAETINNEDQNKHDDLVKINARSPRKDTDSEFRLSVDNNNKEEVTQWVTEDASAIAIRINTIETVKRNKLEEKLFGYISWSSSDNGVAMDNETTGNLERLDQITRTNQLNHLN